MDDITSITSCHITMADVFVWPNYLKKKSRQIRSRIMQATASYYKDQVLSRSNSFLHVYAFPTV